MNQPGQSDDGGDDDEGDEGDAGEGDAGGGGADGSGGGEGEPSVEDMEMSLEENSSDSGDNGDSPGKGQNDKAKEIVDKLMEEFKEQWEPAVENLEAADQAFSGLDNLMDGPTGFDVSEGLWAQRGWKELDALRKKLAELKELRDLVRELGRGSGKGPLKRARAHVDQVRVA
jgi:polyhydroxyalkanoate synthesis regulator phasin